METKNLNQTMSNGTQMNEMVTLPRPMMSFKEAVSTCFSKYATFTGRARRSEYWWFSLFSLLVILIPVIAIILSTIGLGGKEFPEDFTVAGAIIVALSVLAIVVISLALLLPSLAVSTRRLHDTGRSGWWLVVYYVIYAVADILEMFLPDIYKVFDGKETGFFNAIAELFHASPVGFSVLTALHLLTIGLGVTIFIFYLLDSHKGENQYGPSPKYQ